MLNGLEEIICYFPTGTGSDVNKAVWQSRQGDVDVGGGTGDGVGCTLGGTKFINFLLSISSKNSGLSSSF